MATCDTSTLLADAACFVCLPQGIQQILELQLLCELLQAAGGGGLGFQQVYQSAGNPNGVVLVNTTKPCMCIDTVNMVTWLKTDGIISNTGWGS